jgi:hypothetical protein
VERGGRARRLLEAAFGFDDVEAQLTSAPMLLLVSGTPPQSLRALAEKLQRKLNECTDHTAVIHLTAKLKPILEGVEREIDAL